jgi:hypothetical protein
MESGMISANLPSCHFDPHIYGVGAWTPHLHFAYDLVALMRPRVFVELGTDRGESYFTFCQSTAENKTETHCFAVDTWRGDLQAGEYDETTFKQVAAHNRAYYESFSMLMRCTFDAALEKFRSESVDLLHLDGLHSEEAVRHDLGGWLPKLRPGGFLLLHDVTVRSRDFGVWKAWNELSARGRSWTFDEHPGLGVWRKPPNESLPKLLEILLTGGAQDRATLVDYYRGRASQLQEKIAQHWRDGTIRDLPFMQQTVIQIFHTKDGVHREEDSVNARIGHDGWKEVAVALPADAQAAPLRIDFVSPLTVIEVASLHLSSATKIHFQAATAKEFDKITLAGDVERLPSSGGLSLRITGLDPQLYLPPVGCIPNDEKLILEMRLQVQPQTSSTF